MKKPKKPKVYKVTVPYVYYLIAIIKAGSKREARAIFDELPMDLCEEIQDGVADGTYRLTIQEVKRG